MDRQGPLGRALSRARAAPGRRRWPSRVWRGARAAAHAQYGAGGPERAGPDELRRESRSSGGRTGFRSIWRAIGRRGSTTARRADLLREWQVLVRRFIGAPWVVSIADPSSPLANLDLEALEPEAFCELVVVRQGLVGAHRSFRVGAGAQPSPAASTTRPRGGSGRSSGERSSRLGDAPRDLASVHPRSVQSDRRDLGPGGRARSSERPGGRARRRRARWARSSPRERSFSRCGWCRSRTARSRS